MGQQPVIAHADSHAAGQPPKKNGDGNVFPAKHEQGCNRADMECQHEKRSGPVDGLLKGTVSLEYAHGPSVLKTSTSAVTDHRSMSICDAL
jgi:hypothetical protein